MTAPLCRVLACAAIAFIQHSLALAERGDPSIVTPEILLEHVQEHRPEVGALRDISWADGGQRLVISATVDEGSASESGRHYLINSIDVRAGTVSAVGEGYGVSAAPRGDLVAYYALGSKDRRVSLARANGEHVCTVEASKLMPDATAIQAFALTADGSHIVYAVGYGTPQPRRAPPSSGAEGAQVRVFGVNQTNTAEGGVAIWVTDNRCGASRLVTRVDRYRIGRLAWSSERGSIVALAARLIAGQSFPRSDLLVVRPKSQPRWSILRANVGEQARRLNSVSFLHASPDGRYVAVSYDKDGLPYALRKQLAVVSVEDGSIRVVSQDPRQATGWLDANTVWMTVVAPHNSLAAAATLSLGGVERQLPGVSGDTVVSPDGRAVAWMTNDLYGNSTLAIGRLVRERGSPGVHDPRVVWQKELPMNKAYVRAERRVMQCESGDGVRAAAIVTLPLGYRVGQRYPLIVDIHGGPQGGLDIDDLPYAPGGVLVSGTLEHDMWAAKGYVIVSPDYRASGRYGFDKLSRDGNAYARDFQDIMCNVDQVVRDGLADPNRMAVIGHSHGGAEVNWIVTRSQRFKAAISKEGSFNVDAMVSWGQSGYANQLFTTLYGSPLDQPEHYRRMSVIEAVRHVSTPTMFVEHQGGKRAGDLYGWLFAALKHRGVKTQLRIYEDEAHVLQRPADQKDVLDACIDWIDTLVGNPSPSFETSMIQKQPF